MRPSDHPSSTYLSIRERERNIQVLYVRYKPHNMLVNDKKFGRIWLPVHAQIICVCLCINLCLYVQTVVDHRKSVMEVSHLC